jgi:hypothetical protein
MALLAGGELYHAHNALDINLLIPKLSNGKGSKRFCIKKFKSSVDRLL